MRVDRTDASLTTANIQIETRPNIEAESGKSKIIATSQPITSTGIKNLTEADKMDLTVSDKAVIAAIEKANKAISISNRKFEYSIHEKTKEIMIKVINADTNEIVREIPPEKILDMVAKMWEMAGIIVDERR